MSLLVRAAVLGAAYGLAVTCVGLPLAAQRSIAHNMPPMPWLAMRGAALQILLGVVLGLLAAPLARRWLPHLLAVAAAWIGLEWALALDPEMVARWLLAPAAGLVLVLLGRAVARRWPTLPWIVGAVVIVAGVVVPVVRHASKVGAEAASVPLGSPMAGAPDVVLVVLDTVRAESMSAYGYPRETTPRFDALVEDSLFFLDATAPSTWSLPSHASLFTGWFPSGHRAHGEHRVLDEALPTLAEVLREAGYDTRCFTANPHISASFGLTRGFAWSDRAWDAGAAGRGFQFVNRLLDALGLTIDDKGGARVAANFERWLASRGEDARPAFAFLNFLEAHFPYHQVPAEYLARFSDHTAGELRQVSVALLGAQFGRSLSEAEADAARPHARDMYDAGVAYSDHLLDRVVRALEDAGRLDDTILVVLSDHGEMLGEAGGGFGHGPSLREPDLRVPLLVRYPPRIPAGVKIGAPVSTVGVYASVLDLADVVPPGPLHVDSLLPLMDDLPGGVPIIAERYAQDRTRDSSDPLRRADRRYRVYRSGPYKLVQTSAGDRMLFDLAADPWEQRDLGTERADLGAELAAELDDWQMVLGLPPLDAPIDVPGAPAVIDAPAEADTSDIDAAVEDRLRALGYVR